MLHLGAHRTATTRLQKTLDGNIGLLSTEGVAAYIHHGHIKSHNLPDRCRSLIPATPSRPTPIV
jgi:hypothetical protein